MAARKILICDDDADLREALVEQLSLYEEFETIAAEGATRRSRSRAASRSI